MANKQDSIELAFGFEGESQHRGKVQPKQDSIELAFGFQSQNEPNIQSPNKDLSNFFGWVEQIHDTLVENSHHEQFSIVRDAEQQISVVPNDDLTKTQSNSTVPNDDLTKTQPIRMIEVNVEDKQDKKYELVRKYSLISKWAKAVFIISSLPAVLSLVIGICGKHSQPRPSQENIYTIAASSYEQRFNDFVPDLNVPVTCTSDAILISFVG
jgi:hypothetical protein